MAGTMLYIITLIVFVQLSRAFNCSIPPIYVDIHRRAVHGTNVFQYGSFIGIGTPAQNQSIFPSLRQNETSVAHADFCDGSSLPNCLDSTRGNFNPSDSRTWSQQDGYVSKDSSSVFNESINGRDDLHLYTHFFEKEPAFQTLVHNSPVQVATNGSISPGVIGVGQDSTILQNLFESGLIAGRTYSLYVGSGMERAGGMINGSSVYGGYDAGRFTGDLHTYSIRASDEEPLRVRVTDIILDEPSGSIRNVSLFDPSAFPDNHAESLAFDARITTDQYPMSLPYKLTQNYISRLAAKPSGNADGSLALRNPFNGTMTFVLSDGFTVTIPSEVMYNASGISPVAERDEASTEPFYLGLSWLSQVYLMIDYDAYQFHLAQAVAENKAVMPRTFCPKTLPVPYVKPKQSTFGKEGLIGAVVGAVIAGLACIALLITSFVWWRRRRASKKLMKRIEASHGKAKMVEAGFEMEKFAAPPTKEASARTSFWRR